MKRCKTCLVEKPLEQFHKHSQMRDGHVNQCRECRRVYNREYCKRPGTAHRSGREYQRMRKYWPDLSFKEAGVEREKLLFTQGYKCAICERAFKESKTTHIDHDHSTGVVRGILCSSCNHGLGLFRDNPRALLSAKAYLEKFKARI